MLKYRTGWPCFTNCFWERQLFIWQFWTDTGRLIAILYMLIPHSSILTSLTYTYDLIESFVYARHLVTIHNKRNDIISIPLLLEDNELYCLQLYLTQSDDYTQ